MSSYRGVLEGLGGLLLLVWLLSACGGQFPEATAREESRTPPAVSTPTPVSESEPGPVSTLPEPDRAPAGPLPAATPATDTPGRETRRPPVRQVLPERVPTLEPGATTGEVPEALLDAIIEDLIARTGAECQAIDVVRAESVVWNDGSLGCPQPGVMYTQALVDGYWVVLQHGGRTFDYRASDRGYFSLCEQSLSLKPVPPSPGDLPSPDQ